jgi:Uma2 family endonuclease
MPQPQPDWPKTLDEFRAWHERQPEVWEFIDGVPKLMAAPGSMAHPLIKSNAGRLLGNALDQTGCRALVDGPIVEVEGSSLIPDLVVTCSPLDFATPRVVDPIIIVEVLSPSNEKDDTGRKLALYLKIPSLRHYLVIEQGRRQIVHHRRRDDLGGAFLTNIAPADPLRLNPPAPDRA